MRRHAGPLAAGLAVVVGYVLVAGVAVVHLRLLDDGFYARALVRADAYERTYTDVLGDPELVTLHDQLLGQLLPIDVAATDVRALATSAVRWTLPPDRLRVAVEDVLAHVLAYLRGEIDRLDPQVRVDDVLARIDETAVVRARTLLAGAAESVATSREDFADALVRFVALLEEGSVPGTVPVLRDAAADPDAVIELLQDLLGRPLAPRVREQVEVLLVAGEQRDALITALADAVGEHAQQVAARLRATTPADGQLDVLDELAERVGSRRVAVVADANRIRDAARFFGPVTAALGFVLVAAGVAGLVIRGRRDLGRSARHVGVAAAAAGAAVAVTWTCAVSLLESPLARASAGAGGTANLPSGLAGLIRDIDAELAGGLARAALGLALAPVATGALVVVAAATVPALRRVRPAHAMGAAVLVALAAGAATGARVTSEPAPAERRCNGAVELCARRYDEVVQAATHNSMSSPDVVSVWPEHDLGIRAQLDGGIRALLIDTHYWTPLVSPAQLSAVEPFLTAPLVATIFPSLGPLRAAREGTYLCHAHCALGAVPLLDALREVEEFLADEPNEVVTLIVQDEITVEDTVVAFAAAELDELVHVHRPDAPWPTLGELIDGGERLVVLAENQGPPPAWYHDAFELVQDTPYRFESPQALSCLPNRGPPDASLFLLNHWVQRIAPDRSDAAVVNDHDVIVDRARRCADARGTIVNFVAVNFWNIGDVVGAVRTLNGVGAPSGG